MGEFFFEFGLFAAKAATLILIIFGGLALIAGAVAAKNRNKPKETLEIENLNEKFEETKEALEAEILDPFTLKRRHKEKKQKDNKGVTRKTRKIIPTHELCLTKEHIDFIEQTTDLNLPIQHTISNRFNRFTLVGNQKNERATVDTHLA